MMGTAIPITVVDDDEAQLADFMVCVLAKNGSPFTDNVAASCSDCGAGIIHRPHAPKRPPKICLGCAVMRIEGGRA